MIGFVCPGIDYLKCLNAQIVEGMASLGFIVILRAKALLKTSSSARRMFERFAFDSENAKHSPHMMGDFYICRWLRIPYA